MNTKQAESDATSTTKRKGNTRHVPRYLSKYSTDHLTTNPLTKTPNAAARAFVSLCVFVRRGRKDELSLCRDPLVLELRGDGSGTLWSGLKTTGKMSDSGDRLDLENDPAEMFCAQRKLIKLFPVACDIKMRQCDKINKIDFTTSSFKACFTSSLWRLAC